MKFLLILLFYFENLYHIEMNDSLIPLIKKINNDSLLIQKSHHQTKSKEVIDFYKNYFVDGKNLFDLAADNHSKRLKCGLLNLERACYNSNYRIDEIKLDKNTRCINIYGTHLTEPEKYIIQDTVLFVKNNEKKWMIIGNRIGVSSLQLVVYGLLNKEGIEASFTNKCLSQEKIEKYFE